MAGYQEMDMVSHQHIGMNRTIARERCEAKVVQICTAVCGTEEAGLAVDASNDHVLG